VNGVELDANQAKNLVKWNREGRGQVFYWETMKQKRRFYEGLG
jgi:hypothetical protein